MHKDELTMLRKQSEEIAKIEVTDSNREALLKKLCALQTRYRVFEEYIKPEDIEKVYGTKFNILTMDMHKKETNPFTSEWIMDEKELQYYKQILDKKIERIVKGENAEFTRVFGRKQANAVMQIRTLLKSKETADLENYILSKDTMLLGLILAFDKENGFIEFYKNHRFLKYGYSSGAQIYKECGFNVQEESSLEAAYQLENFLEETIGKKSEFNRNNGFLRLYGIYYKENVHKNEPETLILPEGIVSIRGTIIEEYSSIRKRMRNSKTIIFPSTLESIGSLVFANFDYLEKVKFNEGLKYIGFSAFDGCTKLKQAICPNSLRKIEITAFGWCDSLEEVFLNEGLEEIGSGAFRSNHSLRRISLPENEIKCRYNTFAEDNNLTLEIRGTDIPKEFLKSFTEYNSPKQKKLITKLKGIELSDNDVYYGAYYIWGDNNSYFKVITELEAMAQKRKKEKELARE